MIDLYTAPTPNGWKVSIALEELGLPYKVHAIDLIKGDQRSAEFLRRNPNGRIPVICDSEAGGFPIFDSGAILLYLAEKTGRLLPADLPGRYQAIQWLMFQLSGVGPMQGQANVFYRYFEEKFPPVIQRYQKETRRLYEVLNGRLAQRDYLAGELSIADIANWTWPLLHEWSGVSMEGLPHLQEWLKRLGQRPAFRKGKDVPVALDLENMQVDKEKAERIARNARTLVTR